MSEPLIKEEDSSPKKKVKHPVVVKDKVAYEYDVFLTQNLTSQLNLFQFPLRPAWQPYPEASVGSLRMKPKHHKFEMDIKLDTIERFGGLQQMQHSSQSVPLQTNFAVGVVRDGEVHLTPLKHISRFKPAFAHLRKEGIADEMMAVEETSVVPADAQQEQAFRPKQLQVKRKDAPRRAPSQAALRREEDDEPWEELEYHDFTETPENQLFDQLFANNRYEIPFDMTSRDYLQLVARPDLAPAPGKKPARAEVPDVPIVGGGVDSVLQELFNKHALLSYSTITAVLQKAYQADSSLQTLLDERCIMLNGGYALRETGDESLAKDREAILKVFQTNKQAKRSDFNTMSRQLHGSSVGTSAYKKIVSELATFNGSAWVLKEPA